MSTEMLKTKTNVNVDIDDYFSKMEPEDSAAITTMCLAKLCSKANELKALYEQLIKTYSVEMGLCNITLLVQVSSPVLPDAAAQGIFGTAEGIKHALTMLIERGKAIEKENSNG